MKHLFLPAIICRWLDERNGRPANWLDPAYPDFHRPQALISHAVWSGLDMPPVLDHARKNGFLLGDSGGFSIVSRGVSLDPVNVIRWQQKHCTVGVILDVPPYRISGRAYQSAGDIWDASLKRTLDNVCRGLEHYDYEGDSFRWWGVGQGENQEQMQRWYEAVAKIYPFNRPGEGWAIKPTPANNFYSMVRSVRFIQENKVKRVHMLMTTGIKTVAVLLGMLHLTGPIELVTYDSASAGIYTGNRHAWRIRDHGLTLAEWLPRVYTPKDFFEMPCTCPPCTWFKEEYKENPNLEDPLFIDRLALHNHLILFDFFDRIGKLAEKDPEKLIKTYTKANYGDIMRALRQGEVVRRSVSRPVKLVDRI